MNLTLEYEQKADGRWIAEVPQLRGHALFGLLPVGFHDPAPVDAGVVEEAICRHRFAPTTARFGTLTVGSAVNRSTNILARLFSHASPRSSFSNPVSVQGVDAVANYNNIGHSQR